MDVRASFTVSETSVNGCEGAHIQSPSCSKITLSGKLRNLSAGSDEESRARKAVQGPPGLQSLNGTFSVYKLEIKDIFLVNKPAPPRDLTVEAYFYAE